MNISKSRIGMILGWLDNVPRIEQLDADRIKSSKLMQGTKHLDTRRHCIWEVVEKAKWFQPFHCSFWGVGVMLCLLNIFCEGRPIESMITNTAITILQYLWTFSRKMILRIDLFHSGCGYIQKTYAL